MSETVGYIGKMVELEKLENETLEEQCRRILKFEPLKDWEEDYICKLRYTQNYIIHKDRVFEVIKKTEIDINDNRFRGIKNQDGTIDFDVMYYSGGCGISEALENVLDGIEQQEV